MKKKTKWEKPELLVLTKAKPGEWILSFCKGRNSFEPIGPNLGNLGCFTSCGNPCSVVASS